MGKTDNQMRGDAMGQTPIINVHCHLLNFDFVPAKAVRALSEMCEGLARQWWFVPLACVFGFGRSLNSPIGEMRRAGRLVWLFQQALDDLADAYIKEMTRARIAFCTPLMMDLEQAVDKIEDVNYSYRCQCDLISRQVGRHPWRFFPFVMFDPRRQGAAALCIQAIRDGGFIGIKMYPALGYYPSPDAYGEGDEVRKELETMYDFCMGHRIPITAHASVGGAYSVAGGGMPQDAWKFTNISNWTQAIDRYELKVNFAHLGGNYFHSDPEKRERSTLWREEILELIAKSRQGKMKGTVFSDLSFHDMAHHPSHRDTYFRDLRSVLNDGTLSQGLLFGTDASMISHTWREHHFIRPFLDESNLDTSMQHAIMTDNPVSFLFEEGRIPRTHVHFLRTYTRKYGDEDAAFGTLPKWIAKRGGDFYVVSDMPTE